MSRTSDEVTSLVAAVQEHIKFKQLAVYSIDTFCKVLAPPNPRWREYIDVAIDIDAASTVIRVIKKHPGNEAVLMASTRCLSRLAVDATNATIIGEEGGVDAVLESMAANDGLDQEVLLNSLSLIDKMCNHPKSLEKIVTAHMIGNVAKVMEANAADTQVVSLCAKILEKMTRANAGKEGVRAAEADGNSISTPCFAPLASIAATKRCSDEDAASVIDVAKVLIKLIGYDDLGVAASLKSKGALNTLLGVLGVYPDDENMARVVSKLLIVLMEGGIAELIEQIKAGGLSADQVERLLQLLSALAMDGDFADEIAKSGGILAVIGAFEGNISARAMEEIVRLIGRLALSSTNLDDILSSGAIEKLVFCLRQPATPVDLKAQILGAFNKISTQANTTAHVARCPGAVDAIVGALAAHGAESGKVAREGCKFLAALLKEGDGAEAAAAGLTTSGLDAALAALVAAMRANADDVATQLALWKSNLQPDFNLAGTRALGALGATPSAVERLVAFDAAAVVLANLVNHAADAELTKESLYLLSTLVIGAPATGAEAVRVGGGLDAIVAAVCAHPDDASVRKAAIELVESLSNDALVAAKVAELRAFGDKIAAGAASEQEVAAIPLAAMALGVLAMVPANVPRLAANDAATPMLEAGDESGAFPDDEALAAAVAVVKNHTAAVAAVVPELKLIRAICGRNHEAGLRSGVVEAVSKAMAYHCAGEDLTGEAAADGAFAAAWKSTSELGFAAVLETSAGALYGLCKTTEGAAKVGSRNGPKPCIAALGAFVERAAGDEGLRDDGAVAAGLLDCLRVLERVGATAPEAAKQMSQQGAVGALFDAMDAKSGDADFVAQCEKTIGVLVSEEDALALLAKVKAVDLGAVAGGDAETMRDAHGDVGKLGLLLMCGDFAGAIRAARGGETIAELLKATVQAPESKTKANLVRACITALGRAAGRGLRVEGALELVPVLVKELQENPSKDVVNAIASLVSDAEVCEAFVLCGCVEALLPLLDDEQLREPVFACLSAFAKNSGDGAAAIVRGGALPFICAYVSDNMAEARAAVDRGEVTGASPVAEAIRLLANLAAHGDAETLLGAGTLKVIEQILDALGLAPDKDSIEAVVGLMKNLAERHAGLTVDMVKGTARKLLGLMNNLCSLDDVDLAVPGLEQCAELLELLAMDADTAQRFADANAADVLIRAMNKFPNHIGLATKCAAALAKIAGGGSGLEAILAKADELAYASASGDAQVLGELAATMRLLGNLVLQPGLVDQAVADRVMQTIVGALDQLYALAPSDEQQDAIAATLALLSRLMNVEGVVIPEDLALHCLQGAFGEGMGDALKAAACATLGSLARGGPTSIRAIASRGSIEHALSHAAELAADPEGAAALAALLGGVRDPGLLEDALKQVLGVEGGAQALLEALTYMNYAGGFAGYEGCAAAIVAALGKHKDAVAAGATYVAEAVPWKIEHVSALCGSRSVLKQMDALRLHDASMATADGAKLCFAGYEPAFLGLVAEDLVPDGGDGSPGAPIDVSEGVPAARALAAADLIAKAVAHGDADANNGLVHYDLPKAMVNALKSKLRRGEEPFVQNDLYALNGMADTLGVEAMKLSKEAIRLVTDTVRFHPKSAYIQETGAALLAKLTAAFAGGAEEQLEERLNGLAGFHAAAADWQCIASADGAYFFNGATQESAWEQPQAHFAFMQELGDLVGLVDQLDGDLSGIDPSSMAGLVGCLATHSRDAGVLGRLDKMKARLGLREYVAVLNQTALDHMANGVLVLRCLTILGHLAFNNDEVIGYEMEVNVPYTLKWALQQHILDAKLVEIAVFTCSSLLTENEEQKAYVCDQLTPEFVEALKLYAAEASFFTKTMRCMGNMSIVLRTAVELFSNFGATEDDDMDEQATTYLIDGGAIGAIKKVLAEHASANDATLLTACFDALYNIGNDERAARVVTDGGICEMTLDCIRQYDFNAGLLQQCVKLISVLTYNEFSVERLTAIGTTAALLSALAAHANDEEFVVDCMLSLSNLVTVPENARVFLDKSHLKVVFELLDVYDGNAEVVKFVLITLVRLAADDELSKATAEDGISRSCPRTTERSSSAGGIKVLLNTMETFDDDPELIIKTITTLDNLVSADMEYAAVVLERDGEGLLKSCIDKWSHDPAVVQCGQTALLSIQAMLAQKEKGRTNRAALFARLGDDMDASKLKTERLKVKDVDVEPTEDPLKKFRESLKNGIIFKEWKDGKAVSRKLLVGEAFDSVLTREVRGTGAIATRLPLAKIRRAELGNGQGHMQKSLLSKKLKPGAKQGRTRERNSQLQRLLSRPFSTRAKEELCFVVKGINGDDLLCGESKTKADAAYAKEALETMLNCASKWPHRLVSG
ncbi:hypothetical protein JL721_5518 [Aureococcus anophagefferens]|nr:hypothetical protein JL721_5518 [Aureococcus anophagefferens]